MRARTPHSLKMHLCISASNPARDGLYSADVGIVVVNNLADAATYGEFNGFVSGKTVIMVSFDFIFDKIMVLHEMGHAFGAGHQDWKKRNNVKFEGEEPNLSKLVTLHFSSIHTWGPIFDFLHSRRSIETNQRICQSIPTIFMEILQRCSQPKRICGG